MNLKRDKIMNYYNTVVCTNNKCEECIYNITNVNQLDNKYSDKGLGAANQVSNSSN